MARLFAYLRAEDGSSAAEYALILAVIGSALAASMLFLGNSVAGSVNHAAACVHGATPATCA